MRVTIVPTLSDNYSYLVTCSETGQTAVVDPGEAEPIRRALLAEGLELEAVLCTHHHGDHVAAAQQLAGGGRCRVYGPASEAARIPGLTDLVEDGTRLVVGRLEGRVLATPGHTLGSAVYLFGAAAFTGDTLFGAGCGRLFEGDAATLHLSLARLAALPPATELYFGHEYTLKNLEFALTVEPENAAVRARLAEAQARRGEGRPTVPSSVALELATNPFLRCEEATVLAAERSTGGPSPGLATFARLRELRNIF